MPFTSRTSSTQKRTSHTQSTAYSHTTVICFYFWQVCSLSECDLYFMAHETSKYFTLKVMLFAFEVSGQETLLCSPDIAH